MLVMRMKIMVKWAVTKAHMFLTGGARMPLMIWTQDYIVNQWNLQSGLVKCNQAVGAQHQSQSQYSH